MDQILVKELKVKEKSFCKRNIEVGKFKKRTSIILKLLKTKTKMKMEVKFSHDMSSINSIN